MGFNNLSSAEIRYRVMQMQICEHFHWRLSDVEAMPATAIGQVMAYLSGKARAEDEIAAAKQGEE